MSNRESNTKCKIETIISKEQLIFLEKYAQKNKPLESCAILLGKKTNNQFIIAEIKPIENAYRSEIKFTINEDKLFEAYKEAESKDLSVIGIYHTHPSDPYPSKTDVIYMQINQVPWIITSTITGNTRCYLYDEEKGLMNIDLIIMDLF
jgi:proteasome lid subunit RPN8/RPN11